MFDPAEDGITHINIYSKGKTELGRLLSNFAHTPFKYVENMQFESIEGLWYWILTGDERFQKLYGFKAKQLGKEISKTDYPENDSNFYACILHGLTCKYFASKEKIDALMKEDKTASLPFVHYYSFNRGKAIVEPKQGKWMLTFWESIRQSILEIDNA